MQGIGGPIWLTMVLLLAAIWVIYTIYDTARRERNYYSGRYVYPYSKSDLKDLPKGFSRSPFRPTQ